MENSYQAPEILLSNDAYMGTAVDVFAAGIILFMLVFGTMPLEVANPKIDTFYRILCTDPSRYWAEILKANKIDKQEISDSLIELLNGMLALDPSLRLSVQKIKENEW